MDEGSDSKFIVFHHDDQLGEIGFIMNKDGTYSDVVFHDPESDFLDAVEKAVIQVDKEV